MTVITYRGVKYNSEEYKAKVLAGDHNVKDQVRLGLRSSRIRS